VGPTHVTVTAAAAPLRTRCATSSPITTRSAVQWAIVWATAPCTHHPLHPLPPPRRPRHLPNAQSSPGVSVVTAPPAARTQRTRALPRVGTTPNAAAPAPSATDGTVSKRSRQLLRSRWRRRSPSHFSRSPSPPRALPAHRSLSGWPALASFFWPWVELPTHTRQASAALVPLARRRWQGNQAESSRRRRTTTTGLKSRWRPSHLMAPPSRRRRHRCLRSEERKRESCQASHG